MTVDTISVSQTISPLIGHDGGYMFKLPTNTPQVGYVLKILSINPHVTSWVPSSDNITSYTSYNTTSKVLINDVSGTPTNIAELTLNIYTT